MIRSIVLFCLLFLFTSCHTPPKEENPEPDLPNIILLMGDDHGWEETGYNGHPHVQTPILDEMAAGGLRLDRFYSASPVCSPTRASVITGRHPNRCGTFTPNWSIRPEEISVAQLLSDAGYTTGHFGKWHLGPVKADSPTSPGAMGFDEWLSHDNFFEIDPVLSRNGAEPELYKGESSELLIAETIRFIEKAKGQGKPFFAVIWFGSPHEPYSGLEKDLALYADLPEEYSEEMVSLTSMETGKRVERPLRAVLQERYAEITAMDRSIGQLREFLQEAGARQNTLLWYCGDNGVPPSGLVSSITPFRALKGQVYEGGVRVPGIIEWPGFITESRSTTVNSVTSDMLPTLCDLVGISMPDRALDGISLEPLLAGQMSERPQPICFWNYDAGQDINANLEPYIDPALQEGTTPLVKMMNGKYTRSFRNFHHPEITESNFTGARAILDNRYKLVLDAKVKGEESKELFDLQDDPGEQNDLYEREKEMADRLEKQLRDWQQSVLESLTGKDY